MWGVLIFEAIPCTSNIKLIFYLMHPQEVQNSEDALRVKHDELKLQLARATDELKESGVASGKRIAALEKEVVVLKDSTMVSAVFIVFWALSFGC